jgi:hypothetical protein
MQDWELINHLVGLWPRIEDQDKLEKLLTEGRAGTMFGVLNLVSMDPEKARSVMDQARGEFEHIEATVKGRKDLDRNIEEAMSAVLLAQYCLKQLSRLGDVEYEGGHADTERHLEDAGRALRAAQAVKPSDKNGELR